MVSYGFPGFCEVLVMFLFGALLVFKSFIVDCC